MVKLGGWWSVGDSGVGGILAEDLGAGMTSGEVDSLHQRCELDI